MPSGCGARRLDLLLVVRARRAAVAAVLAITVGIGRAAAAQTEYRDLDAGRPLRIEDASPAERGALDLQLPTGRVDFVAGSGARWQAAPKLAFGVLPLTEVEVRAPLVYREPGIAPRAGFAGLGIGATHAFNVETTRLPAIAVGAELLLPVGSMAAPRATASVKGIATRSFGFGRVHVNASLGTYAQPGLPVFGGCPDGTQPGAIPGSCIPIETIPPFDPPCRPVREATTFQCDAAPSRPAAALPTAASRSGSAASAREFRTPTRTGTRWLVGLAADKTWPLKSLLVGADVFAEHFRGLGLPVDWTAEVGARHQLSPRLTLDAGAGHRFAGATRAWFVTAGLTREFGI